MSSTNDWRRRLEEDADDPLVRLPDSIVLSPSNKGSIEGTEATVFPSFHEYMERCLHDEGIGYYGAGRVRFGRGQHFWTYPSRLRPAFGQMVAEAARRVFCALVETGIPDDAPLTILEFGGGEAQLARDVLTYVIEQSETDEWKPFAQRVRYVIVEKNTAIRDRQRNVLTTWIASGRADLIAGDASEFSWDGPFYGFVVANELIDVFPCERIRWRSDGPRRVHVAPVVDKEIADRFDTVQLSHKGTEHFALTSEGFFAALKNETWQSLDPRFSAIEIEIPLRSEDSAELRDYAQQISPLAADLATCDLLPADVFWPPALARFADVVAQLLSGPNRCGGSCVLDYGGTSRHIVDPNTREAHLRIYGTLHAYDHLPLPYIAPGESDITCDVDFTELSRQLRMRGLSVPFFGHQRVLEQFGGALDAGETFRRIVDSRQREEEEDRDDAEYESRRMISSFRRSSGFRVLFAASDTLTLDFGDLGPSDQVDDLSTIAARVSPQALAQMAADWGLPPEITQSIGPCGDVTGDLDDRGLYAFRHGLLEMLRIRRWLVDPGDIAKQID